MNRYQPTRLNYQPSTPRAAFGLTALAMSAIVLSIFVVVPAGVEAASHEPALAAMSLRCTAGL